MSTSLAESPQTVPDHTHAVMVLDQAGWHDARARACLRASPSCRCLLTALS